MTQNLYMTLCFPKMQPHTKFGLDRRNAPDTIILKSRSEVKVTVTMVYDTLPSQDASTHQILNSNLKEYRSKAPDSMPILEARSEVKVTMTEKWNGTIRHSKMHSHTKFGIPTSNNIRNTQIPCQKTISSTSFQTEVVNTYKNRLNETFFFECVKGITFPDH